MQDLTLGCNERLQNQKIAMFNMLGSPKWLVVKNRAYQDLDKPLEIFTK